MPIYPPPAFFWWWYFYDTYARTVFWEGGAIAASGGFISIAVAITMTVLRAREAADVDTYGSARWAARAEVEAAGLLGSDGVVLGKLVQTYLRHDGPEHVLCFAPTRSGKGVGLVIPTLLSWQHSAVIHDIKGENWELTSGWRSSFSRTVRFDPTHPNTLRYNPLLEVRKGEHEVADVQNIADILVDPEGGLERKSHWDKTANALLVGAILHVLYAEENKSLAGVARFLSHPSRSFYATLERMLCTNHLGTGLTPKTHKIVAESARELLNKSENERSGVLSTALSFLSLYRDPIVARATSVSDFCIQDLISGDAALSLYLVVPPSDISRTRPLVRLMLNQISRRLTEERSKREGRRQVLLMLDEFPALGRFQYFEDSLGYMAGFGVRAFLIAQSLNQITKTYGPDTSILDHCHVRVAFATNDERTAKRISDALGTTTELRAMKNYAGHRLAPWLSHVMVSRQETARQLMTPGEVMQLPADEEIVMVAGTPPIRGKKLKYYEDRNFTPRVVPQVRPAQSNDGADFSGAGTAWAGLRAGIHEQLIAEAKSSDDEGGHQQTPRIEQDPNLAPEPKTEPDPSAELDSAPDQSDARQKDLFNEPVTEADAFDELTTARLLKGRER